MFNYNDVEFLVQDGDGVVKYCENSLKLLLMKCHKVARK